ncbi:phosphoribosyl formimino-5-aminoimidazole isomerase [Cenarchaeum symbiosum A]|uniref:1-(5-phosphoribosyl)-5-[(5-phosphoribosylamino)methylideneamino] imidazole-4-carboxamide isomerase n=1 Tax=Cenarchaeum symbiosum (strain A) TaxID=414004 RepID=HIS4_CENSY|nr:RecName: Full=1-(5-phosphoribosyl)-5-[(5-phosphoribosylamino)methylideneamino] imidazole-4-carboxamide isomerase; AltName: Full=Phosphoribosylformimino-5-aminoimidazole carboxamide ribotide isomerase [Cenarchaeum symbiosum A]ABK78644.1 phosphoribosyl formimino-5-aminoimidazole isomerase [Cenarchaeum symbiosum A]
MKVIPAIDLMDGQVVRLRRGKAKDKTVYSDDPVKVALTWEKDGADMLHIVDLDATLGRGNNIDMIRNITDAVSIPVEAAGGLRSIDLVAGALEGADRVVLGTLAFRDRDALREILESYGSKKIVISVDHVKGKIMVDGWRENTGINLVDAMQGFVGAGFTEFLLTDVDRDGMMQGPETDTLGKVCRMSDSHVIASGGITVPGDVKSVRDAGAWGVILGKALYEGKVSVKGAISC